ncbi:MAG: ABC transporter ATP-binding protein [Firmicutes bacterium]|nr:ABC transporter ATP-binding protein [Bacillota bacterium]
MKQQQALLDIKDLHVHFKVYGGYARVLNDVNLSVFTGEKIGLVGESGCGKTTTVKSIMRVLPKQAVIAGGEILFEGQDVLRMKDKALNVLRGQKLSMIFQDPVAALNPVFTVGKQICDAIRFSGITKGNNKSEIRKLAVKALKECSMPDPYRILDNYPFQLSGGMRQRVCIAMALATASSLMIADEPTTNLDVTIQDQVLHLIRDLVEKNNTALILITHSLGVAREMTDRIYVMYAGNIVEMASTEEIFEAPYHPYTKGLLNSIPKLTGDGIMAGIDGYLPDYLNPPLGCRFQSRCSYASEYCGKGKPPFIEVIPEHYVACYRYSESWQKNKLGV